jgi:hypothetical protein
VKTKESCGVWKITEARPLVFEAMAATMSRLAGEMDREGYSDGRSEAGPKKDGCTSNQCRDRSRHGGGVGRGS